MKPEAAKGHRIAFTQFECLIVVAIVALISVIAVSRVSAQAGASTRMACLKNIRQVGLGFSIWADRNGNRFPWHVPPKRGSLEWANTPETYRHFQIASNELDSPNILVCPDDPARAKTESFDKHFSNTNISYLIGLEANERRPESIVCADRNLSTNASRILSGVIEFTDADSSGWAAGIHTGGGNIGLADGSARYLSQIGIRKQLAVPGNLPTRFSIP